MINEVDVRAKSDDELVEIWSNEPDYLPQVVEWVRAEIERRKLDISSLRARTPQEAAQSREISRLFTDVRLLTLAQAIMGLLFLGIAFVTFMDASMPESTYHGRPIRMYESKSTGMGAALSFFVIGMLFLVYAVGVWKRKKWAFASGFYIYAVITVCNALVTALVAITVFLPGGASSIGPLLVAVLFTVAAARIMSMFRTLRKNASEVPA